MCVCACLLIWSLNCWAEPLVAREEHSYKATLVSQIIMWLCDCSLFSSLVFSHWTPLTRPPVLTSECLHLLHTAVTSIIISERRPLPSFFRSFLLEQFQCFANILTKHFLEWMGNSRRKKEIDDSMALYSNVVYIYLSTTLCHAVYKWCLSESKRQKRCLVAKEPLNLFTSVNEWKNGCDKAWSEACTENQSSHPSWPLTEMFPRFQK